MPSDQSACLGWKHSSLDILLMVMKSAIFVWHLGQCVKLNTTRGHRTKGWKVMSLVSVPLHTDLGSFSSSGLDYLEDLLERGGCSFSKCARPLVVARQNYLFEKIIMKLLDLPYVRNTQHPVITQHPVKILVWSFNSANFLRLSWKCSLYNNLTAAKIEFI